MNIEIGKWYHLDNGLLAKIEFCDEDGIYSGFVHDIPSYTTWWNEDGQNVYYDWGKIKRADPDHDLVEEAKEGKYCHLPELP